MNEVGPPQIQKQQIDYAEQADNYDERRFASKRDRYLEENRRRAVLKVLGKAPLDRNGLDVGCGTARGLLSLASAGFTRATGVDFTPSMLARARTKLSTQRPEFLVRLVRADAFSLPVRSKCFETVISLNFLHLFPYRRQQMLVREMHRACVPGGLVVVELENVHKLFLVTRYVEQYRNRHTTKLNNIFETRNLLPRELFEDVRVLGVDLPLAHRVLKHFPSVGLKIEKASHYTPVKWLAGRVLVSGRRRFS